MHRYLYVTKNPRIAEGKPIIAGTRITVEGIVIRLRRGETPQKIAQHLGLTFEQVQEAEQYALATSLALPTPEEDQADINRWFYGR